MIRATIEVSPFSSFGMKPTLVLTALGASIDA
jgi:hypothetical protein